MTLAIDIGGTGIKVMRVSARGKPLSERARVLTPRPATPRAVLAALRPVLAAQERFDRVAVGFPGVVQRGVTHSAPNLHPSWAGFDLGAKLEALTGRPTRVMNDAGIQGFGVIEGTGVEACVTLGTGMGFSLFVDGMYVPNIELGHHPLKDDRTYEDLVSDAALKKVGKRRWLKRVRQVVDQIRATFNPREICLGGGNSRIIREPFAPDVRVVGNVAGLLGGARAFDRIPGPLPSTRRHVRRTVRDRAAPETRRRLRVG